MLFLFLLILACTHTCLEKEGAEFFFQNVELLLVNIIYSVIVFWLE